MRPRPKPRPEIERRGLFQRLQVPLLALALVANLAGCHLPFRDSEFRSAERAMRDQNYKEAVRFYARVVKRHPESEMALISARTAARVSLFQIEDFSRAVEFFRHLIMYSNDAQERRDAQRNIAAIYFEKLSDYKNAVLEYNKLLTLPHTPEEAFEFRFQVAKANYYLNNFFQARIEVDDLLKRTDVSDRQRFDLSVFKANVLLADKQVEEALKLYIELDRQFPEFSRQEKIGMSIAVCYEELNDYDKSISVLEELKKDYPRPDFIELKIKRLQQRRANLPGAKGFRK